MKASMMIHAGTGIDPELVVHCAWRHVGEVVELGTARKYFCCYVKVLFVILWNIMMIFLGLIQHSPRNCCLKGCFGQFGSGTILLLRLNTIYNVVKW